MTKGDQDLSDPELRRSFIKAVVSAFRDADSITGVIDAVAGLDDSIRQGSSVPFAKKLRAVARINRPLADGIQERVKSLTDIDLDLPQAEQVTGRM